MRVHLDQEPTGPSFVIHILSKSQGAFLRLCDWIKGISILDSQKLNFPWTPRSAEGKQLCEGGRGGCVCTWVLLTVWLGEALRQYRDVSEVY